MKYKRKRIMMKSRVYALRGFGAFCIVYGAGLMIYGAGSGMAPGWLILGAVCIALTLRPLFELVFSMQWIQGILIAVVTVIVLFSGVIIAYGYGSKPAEVSDFIIVLGAKVNGETPSRTLRYRLETAYDYLTAHPDTKAVLSGGQGANEGISEAEAMRRYLEARGIDRVRLILEDRSSNTYENLRNSFELLGNDKQLKLTVISSDFHILRAKIIASRLGLQVRGIGAKTFLPLIPNYYLREILAIVKELF